tara:strand:+ start:204 stop:449 length:246 start_codon:yes stop_codon:yes gene_type:complete
MAVAQYKTKDGVAFLRKMFLKTGIENFAKMRQRCWHETGVADGGADFTLTGVAKGDFLYDVDNDDYYICTVAATTVVQIHA